MAFSDYQIFPCRIVDATTGLPIAPGFGRREINPKDTSSAQSGSSQRLRRWTRPLWEFSITSPGISATVRANLDNFYNAHNTGIDTFLFRDPDFYAQTTCSVGTGTGALQVFQLKLTYTFGKTFTHNATMIKAATVVIKLDNTPTADYTLNAETGVVTFTSAPGLGVAITWSGEFYRKCTMLDPPDYSRTSVVSWDATYKLTEVL